MHRNLRLAILLVPIALALASATVAPTTSTFVDDEVVSGNELEAGDGYGLERENSTEGNTTDESNGIESGNETDADSEMNETDATSENETSE